MAGANRLYSAHLNKYALQVFDILGMKDMDIEAAEGVEIRLADGRSLMDFSAGLGVAALGHNHPRIIEAERKCHNRKVIDCIKLAPHKLQGRSEEHTSELQSLMRISYAVFCLKKKTN